MSACKVECVCACTHVVFFVMKQRVCNPRDTEKGREKERKRECLCVCEREYVCACTYVASFVMHAGPKGGHLGEREKEREREREKERKRVFE